MDRSAPADTTLDRLSGVDFEQYVIGARQRLFRFAVVLCGDHVLAGDLVTDVLGRAYEQWDRVGAADDVHAYVRRMVVNEFISWKRRATRTAPRADVGDLLDQQAAAAGPNGRSGADPQDAHTERAALLDELSRLRPKHRAALVLRFYEDLGDDDIAAVLGCRVGTVRSYVSRGLATLRVSLDPALARTASPSASPSADRTTS